MSIEFWLGPQDLTWWRMLLGVVGVVVVMKYDLTPKEAATWLYGILRSPTEKWEKIVTPILCIVIGTMILATWWYGFVAFSGILGWGISALFMAAFWFVYWIKKRFPVPRQEQK